MIGKIGLFGLAAAAMIAWPAPSRAGPSESRADLLRALGEAAGQQDCDSMVRIGRRLLVADKTELPDAMRAQLYDMIIQCETSLDRKQDAYQDALQATALAEASAGAWETRLFREFNDKRYDAMLGTLEEMHARQPAFVDALPIEAMWTFQARLQHDDAHAADLRLLKLLSTDYRPVIPFGDVDHFRLLYARKLYDAGQKETARPIVNMIQLFSELVLLSLDSDLRPLRASRIDLRAEAERMLATDRALLAAHPDRLAGIIAVVGDLNRLGRYRDALSLLESARAGVDKAGTFVDRDQMANWWWQKRADTYSLLGDYNNVISSLRTGAAQGEHGTPNISQTLNLAENQIEFGHPDQALETIKGMAPAQNNRSPFGDLVLRYDHGCASFLLGRKKEAAEDVAYAMAHEKDNPGSVTGLLMCTGDIDAAAASLVRRLAEPEQKSQTLLALSDFRPDDPNQPQSPGQKLWPVLKARADVRAAIAKAGGIVSFPFRRDEL
jgi:tetratricopeptide (TPR) repeat protein